MKKRERVQGSYYGFPKRVLNSPAYVALGYSAKALLVDLRTQYNGFNNGDLHCAWSVMSRERGWRSKETLYSALQELIQAGFVKQTRKGERIGLGYGGGRHVPTLFALTWERVDKYAGDSVLPTNEYLEAREKLKRRRRKTAKSDPETVLANPEKRTCPSTEIVHGASSHQRNEAGFPSTEAQPPSTEIGHLINYQGEHGRGLDDFISRYCFFDIPLHGAVA